MVEEVKPEVKEAPAKAGKTASGLEPNVAAILAYLFDFVGGLIFFLIEKDNKFIKFAAMQSMVLSVFYWALYLVVLPIFSVATVGFGVLLYPVLWLGYLALRIVLMVKAYNNEEWELPLIGKIARNVAK